jgi:23S rRNA (pseudouridine1915-N3)-methyltransferase
VKFRFVWVGKTRNANYRALQDDYLRRLSHFVTCTVDEIRDTDPPGNTAIEGERILTKVNQTSFVCLMDVEGRKLTSHQLAKEVENWQNAGHKEVVFVIGGFSGVSKAVADAADLKLSLSFLTFTHEMARVILLEQLYRALTIIKGFPYQK